MTRSTFHGSGNRRVVLCDSGARARRPGRSTGIICGSSRWDTTLSADASASYEALTAMKDHVLAPGEVIGLGQVDPSERTAGFL